MTYNFNFNIEKDGSPYGTTDTAAIYIAQELERRITSDKPLLEYRISTELKSTSEVVLTETEKNHLLSVLTSLSIDNYFKGQLTHPLVTDVVDGVPVKVTRWQLRAQLAIQGKLKYNGIKLSNITNFKSGIYFRRYLLEVERLCLGCL